jgi:glycosyltransferase involved in cell wall biosynthesis
MTSNRFNGVPVDSVGRWGTCFSVPVSPSYASALAHCSGDILHIHEPFPLADLALALRPEVLHNFKCMVVTWHGDIARQSWALPLYRHLVHPVLRRADRIFASSPSLVENSLFLKPHRDRCTVLPLGLDLSWTAGFDLRRKRVEEIRRTFKAPFILFVGRLVYYKGLRYLVESLGMVPDARLVIIGSGPLKRALEQQIDELRLEDRATILPHVPDDELHAFYEACDLLVLPSTERSEAFGLVQIEAMACAKPVVSTEIGTGTTFINQNGVTGITVPPREPKALARAINELLADQDLRIRLGRRGRERALEEFTVEQMVARTLVAYREILSLKER